MRRSLICVAALLVASPAFAQQGALSQAFEGKTVVVKIDMPASSDGVEVRPLASPPVDYQRLGRLVKADGVGVHRGESIMVTKVLVKDHHIEFQLGGGGYGTAGDLLTQGLSTPTVPYEYKSRRQKDIENELKYTYDYRRREELKRELNEMDHDRYRDNTVAAVVNAQTQAANQVKIQNQRAQSGSRFNIRYNDGFPEGALTPAGVMRALGQYVDFNGAEGASAWSVAPSAPAAGAAPGAIRKGLTVVQVEQVLGPATDVSTTTEGSMQVSVRKYNTDTDQISGKFVGGVLVDYSITPRR